MDAGNDDLTSHLSTRRPRFILSLAQPSSSFQQLSVVSMLPSRDILWSLPLPFNRWKNVQMISGLSDFTTVVKQRKCWAKGRWQGPHSIVIVIAVLCRRKVAYIEYL